MMTFDQFVKWEAASKDTVDFKRVYAHMAGDALAGLMLSQIVFWHLPNKNGETKLRVEKDGNLWMAVPREDWFEAICVTARQADRLLRQLSEICQNDAGDSRPPLVETKLYKFSGTPTPHIRLLHDNFLAVLALCMDGQSYIQKHKPRGKATLLISKVADDNKTVKSTSLISKVALQISKVDITNQESPLTETTNRDYTKTSKKRIAADAAPSVQPSKPPLKIAKPAQTPTPHQALVGMIAKASFLDLGVARNKGRVVKAAGELGAAGATPEQVETHYVGFQSWWFTQCDHWAARKRQRPTPEFICETWEWWNNAIPGPSVNGGNGHARAAPVSKAQAETDRIMAMMFGSTPAADDSNTIDARHRHG